MSLRPKSDELITQALMINESATQYGYRCKMLIPSSIELPQIGFQQDVGYNEEDAIELYAIPVNGNLQPKLLKS